MSEFDLVKRLRAIGFKGSDEEANGLLGYIGLLESPKGKGKINSPADLGAYVGGRLDMVTTDLLNMDTEGTDLPTPEMVEAMVGLSLLCQVKIPDILGGLSFAANYREPR